MAKMEKRQEFDRRNQTPLILMQEDILDQEVHGKMASSLPVYLANLIRHRACLRHIVGH